MANKLDFQTLINDLDFYVVDTETTGGNARLDRVIDVAVFHFKAGRVEKKFSSLVNPHRLIPTWITALTGIDNAMVEHAPSFSEIADELWRIMKNGIFAAHNAGFDQAFLRLEFHRSGYVFSPPQVCTLRLARQLMPELPSRSLGQLCESLLIDIWDRHRAHGDAEATAYVLKDFLRRLEGQHGIRTWGGLQSFQDVGVMILPNGIDYQTVLELPNKPGVYIFKDADGQVVARGKVTDVQRRVKTYFKKTNNSEKSNRFRSVVKSIEIQPI